MGGEGGGGGVKMHQGRGAASLLGGEPDNLLNPNLLGSDVCPRIPLENTPEYVDIRVFQAYSGIRVFHFGIRIANSEIFE